MTTLHDLDWSELDGIVKHRYETGDYGHAHLAISQPLWNAIQARDLPKPPARPPWEADLFQLTGLPVVIDDTLDPDGWQLVDNSTQETIRSGTVRTTP